jgi:hypothetical protein
MRGGPFCIARRAPEGVTMTDTAVGRSSYKITEFCERNALSKTRYHKLQRAGRGPVEMRDGQTVRISAEAEIEWQRALAQPTADTKRSRKVAQQKGRLGGQLSAQSPRHISRRRAVAR